LINYLARPINFDPAGRSIIVAGKTTLNSDFDGLPKSIAGEKALLYLPGNDEDYDVVFLQTESGVTLTKSFNQGVWREVKDPRLSSAIRSLAAGERGPHYDRTASPTRSSMIAPFGVRRCPVAGY
jgi:hypothetical protein